jgi:hypothetical protein
MRSGKWLTLILLGVGLAAAGLAVWVRYQQGRQAQQFWGTSRALLIRDAAAVRWLRLARESAGDASSERPGVSIRGRTWLVTDSRDVTEAPGLLHVRQALLDDQSFDFSTRPADCPHAELVALRFEHGGEPLVVVLDVGCAALSTSQHPQAVSIGPLVPFLERWLRQVQPAVP